MAGGSRVVKMEVVYSDTVDRILPGNGQSKALMPYVIWNTVLV